MSFREFTPGRRPIITSVSHYSEHRQDLIVDFKMRCGYCNDIHFYRIAPFEIDHFIPLKKNKQPFLTIKLNTDYSNLVYACRSCNNAKRNKWPSGDQNISIVGNTGFIDPCDENYNNNFIRLESGKITAITEIGQWIFKELKFSKPQHEIIYNIEKLDLIIDELEENLEKINDLEICKRINVLLLRYRKYVRQLGNQR